MELDLKGVLRIFRKWAWAVLLLAIAAGAATGYYSSNYIDKQYQASTKVIVNKTRTVAGVQDLSLNDLNAQIQLIATYKEVIKTPWMMSDVVRKHPEFNLTVSQLNDKIKVSSVSNTQIMTFTASDTSYAKAAAIINAVTDEFVAKIPGLMKIDNVTVLNRADLNDKVSPVTPNPQLNTIIAALLALLIGSAIALLSEYFDNSVKSEEFVKQYLGLPTLASISRIKRSDLKARSAESVDHTGKTGDPGYAATPQ